MRWFLLWSVLLFAGCAAPVSDVYLHWVQRSWTVPDTALLGPGDRFEIRVYQEPDLSGEYTVSDAGTINFPLIGTVTVQGRSCTEIESELDRRLSDGLLRAPAATCRVLDLRSMRISVVGQVQKPGTFPYSSGLTVVEAIAAASGFSENAAADRAIVTRVVDGQVVEIPVPLQEVMRGRAPNLRLWPSDTVFVPTYQLLP